MPPALGATVFPEAGKSGRVNGGGSAGSKTSRSIRISREISKKADNVITINHLPKLNHRNISAWHMKRLMKIVRHGSLSTLDEQILNSAKNDEATKQIRSENEAKAAARKIFQNVARQGAKFIYLRDLTRLMRREEAMKTMGLLEGTRESKRISKLSLKNWLVNALREQRALATSMAALTWEMQLNSVSTFPFLLKRPPP